MKDGGWIPVDKRLVSFLPKDRPYTELEAVFSLTKDIDENNEKSIREYARIWSWSRQKVVDFMEKLRATNKPIESQKKADRKPPFRLINNRLQGEESQKKADEKPEEGQKKAGTIYPNPNPANPKPKTISPEALRLSEVLAGKIIFNNPKNKTITDATKIKWADAIDKLNRLDKQAWEDIEAVLCWSQQDLFWKSNILSGDKLRDKWDKLTAKMQQTKPQLSAQPEQNKAAYIPGTPEYKARLNDICMRSL